MAASLLYLPLSLLFGPVAPGGTEARVDSGFMTLRVHGLTVHQEGVETSTGLDRNKILKIPTPQDLPRNQATLMTQMTTLVRQRGIRVIRRHRPHLLLQLQHRRQVDQA